MLTRGLASLEKLLTSEPARRLRRVLAGSVELRLVTSTDHEALEALRGPSPVQGSAEQFEIVAFRRGRIIGWTSVSPMWTHLGLVEMFSGGTYVRRRHRGLGAGRALLQAALGEAERRNMGPIWANIDVTNVRSDALYRSVGFVPIHAPTMREAIEKDYAMRCGRDVRQEVYRHVGSRS